MIGGGIIGVVAFLGGLGIVPLKADWGLFIAYAVSMVIMFVVSAGDKQNRVPMVKQDF